MKIEDQVCTLEQAKELKELGLELESYFVWAEQYDNPDAKYEIWPRNPLESILRKRTDYKRYSAYSCAELWELFKTVLDYESTHTLTYAFLHECVTAMYKSKIPDAHCLTDKIIEALKIKMVIPSHLAL